jgi:hypothetical protein
MEPQAWHRMAAATGDDGTCLVAAAVSAASSRIPSARVVRRGARAVAFFEDVEIGGGSDVPPQRESALDVTLAQEIAPGWTLDTSVWRRRATNVNDPNVFFGTTVTVPNSVARQHAAGFDV